MTADDPRRHLARHASRLLRLVARETWPERWGELRFGREVELVRRHLAPIRSRSLLAASFGREGFRVAPPDDADVTAALATSPAAVAYAVRWLELGDGRTWPAFAGAARPRSGAQPTRRLRSALLPPSPARRQARTGVPTAG